MARQPRFFVLGEALHVIHRGNNREPIFAGEEEWADLPIFTARKVESDP